MKIKAFSATTAILTILAVPAGAAFSFSYIDLGVVDLNENHAQEAELEANKENFNAKNERGQGLFGIFLTLWQRLKEGVE